MPETPDRDSLSAVDWLVIVAASACLIVAVALVVQGKPPEPAAAE